MFYICYFSIGGQIRSRHRYGGAKILTFQQNHNTSIALSVPEGGQTPLPISMGGHGRICPPWIHHCKQLQSENKLVGNASLRVKKWGNVVPRPTTPLPISQRFSTFCDSRTTYKFCFSVADHH